MDLALCNKEWLEPFPVLEALVLDAPVSLIVAAKETWCVQLEESVMVLMDVLQLKVKQSNQVDLELV